MHVQMISGRLGLPGTGARLEASRRYAAGFEFQDSHGHMHYTMQRTTLRISSGTFAFANNSIRVRPSCYPGIATQHNTCLLTLCPCSGLSTFMDGSPRILGLASV